MSEEKHRMNRREFMKATGVSIITGSMLDNKLTQKVKSEDKKYTADNNSNTKVNEDFLKYEIAWTEGAIVNRCFSI